MGNKKTVLFGAGAEVCFGLSSGADFAKAVLGLICSKMNKPIEEHYSKKIKLLNNNWYSKYVSPSWEEEDLLKASIKKKVLDNSQSSMENMSKVKYEEDVENEFIKLKGDAEEIIKTINSYTSYMGILDEKFHTLISPKCLGPKKFWQVINCYTRAYLFLVGKIVYPEKTLSAEDYSYILENPKSVIEKTKEFCSKNMETQSYYRVLREFIQANSNEQQSENPVYVITSNYSKLAKSIIGVDCKNIAYVHGRFEWFESAYQLKVIDIEYQEITDDDIYFPYIAIQSGVKPIVDSKQIKEYSKMIDFLWNSDKLIIVGYKINSDDNHINCIIKEFLVSREGTIEYLDYDGVGIDKILERLRIPKESDVASRLSYTQINSNNCFDKFRESLKCTTKAHV